jgi:hypothetical protein
MSTRTTITLDQDVIERVKLESRLRGESFRDTLNGLLRTALLKDTSQSRSLQIRPTPMGFKLGVNYDDIESLLAMGEGDQHR